jgi:hypothetical protein
LYQLRIKAVASPFEPVSNTHYFHPESDFLRKAALSNTFRKKSIYNLLVRQASGTSKPCLLPGFQHAAGGEGVRKKIPEQMDTFRQKDISFHTP